jgi:hypothetical protein
MWQFEYSVTGNNISKEQVWAVWSDVNNWNKWDDDIDSSEGDFMDGAALSIKPKRGPRVNATMTCKLRQSFTVKSALPLGTKVEFTHFLTETPVGLKITHGITIQGPLTFLFKYVIGKSVEKNLPSTMNKLLNIAESKSRGPHD